MDFSAESVCLVFNPTARGDRAARLQSLLDGWSSRCQLCATDAAGAARRIARKAVEKGCTTILAAGGDGTVNEVLNGIGDVPGAFERIRLGVIPLGTVNVFAKELGLPLEPEAAWEQAGRGRTRQIDLGLAEYEGSHSYFVQLAGAGLDSRAIAQVNLEWKKKIGAMAYVAAGLKAFASSQVSMEVEAEGRRTTGEMVLIGNGRYYGGRFLLFPNATLDDGLLDVCVFHRVDWNLLVRAGWGLLRDRLSDQPGVEYFQTPSLHISTKKPLLFELEGENIGPLPARFSIAPHKLQVLC